MQRNEVTTAGELSIGDVFYKLKDKAKKPYEKVEGEAKVTEYATYSVNARRHGQKHTDSMKSNTQVVFLRSVSANHPII